MRLLLIFMLCLLLTSCIAIKESVSGSDTSVSSKKISQQQENTSNELRVVGSDEDGIFKVEREN